MLFLAAQDDSFREAPPLSDGSPGLREGVSFYQNESTKSAAFSKISED